MTSLTHPFSVPDPIEWPSTLEVTTEDIHNGERARAASCPIALAVRRTFPWVEGVVAVHGAAYMWVRAGDLKTFTEWRMRIPSAREWMAKFDLSESDEVGPRVFQIESVDLRQGDRSFSPSLPLSIEILTHE